LNERVKGNEKKIKKKLLDDWLEKVIYKGFANHYKSFSPESMIKYGLIHYNVWTPHEVIELLVSTGFRVIDSHAIVPDRKDSFLIICDTPSKSE